MAKVISVQLSSPQVTKTVKEQLFVGVNLSVVASATREEAHGKVAYPVALRMMRLYKRALRLIGVFLANPGQTDILTGGRRTVQLDTVKARTPYWRRLTAGYIATWPDSTTFWNKTGRLAKVYGQAIAPSLNDKPQLQFRALDVRKTRLTLDYTVGFKALPDPLDKIITEPFVTGVPYVGLKTRGFGNDQAIRRTIVRMTFPEHDRPVISLLASRLGKEMRANIRKLETQ